MGKVSPTDREKANVVLSGSLTATGSSNWQEIVGTFNVALTISGTQTLKLQRSFDGGTTAIDVSSDSAGTAASYTASATFNCFEPEEGVLWRVNCSAYTSGTGTYRISQ